MCAHKCAYACRKGSDLLSPFITSNSLSETTLLTERDACEFGKTPEESLPLLSITGVTGV